ncbi:hypothetical protein C0995_012660 [Termitomyces sp. Mi166|nr:hypothetical protein C0995_012660 [Termitomyces sp. Mi166\
MSPTSGSSSTILSSDSSSPSIPEHVIHKWDGTKYNHANGNFTQWTEKLKDAIILNGIYAYVFNPVLLCSSIDMELQAHANWNLNDCLAITFIRAFDIVTTMAQVQHAARIAIHKGGGMAGKSVTDAQAAQRASKKKPDTSSTNSSIQAKSFVAVTGLDGKLWYVDSSSLGQLPAPSEMAAFASMAMGQTPYPAPDHSTKCWENAEFMAF